jgi:superfamily I DNA/RNA helicase
VPHPQCPEGSPVETYSVPSGEECKKVVSRVLRDLLRNQGFKPNQIIILSPHRLEHSSVAGLDEVDGTPLKGFPCGVEGAIQHATISGFKGLESDAVVLIDVNPEDPRSDARAQYVAASRAKHFLAVIQKVVGEP